MQVCQTMSCDSDKDCNRDEACFFDKPPPAPGSCIRFSGL
uniref:Uncharacterized protein n=1 Tax=Tetranychus urticae TaxID=32264 RepID=T1KKU7_TETUR